MRNRALDSSLKRLRATGRGVLLLAGTALLARGAFLLGGELARPAQALPRPFSRASVEQPADSWGDSLLEEDELAGFAPFPPPPRGWRDPFHSLHPADRAAASARSPRAQRLARTRIDDLEVTGIYRISFGAVAKARVGGRGPRFLLRPGDRLADGEVAWIGIDAGERAEIGFLQRRADGRGPLREVRRLARAQFLRPRPLVSTERRGDVDTRPRWRSSGDFSCEGLAHSGDSRLVEAVERADFRLQALAWDLSLAGPEDGPYRQDAGADALYDLERILRSLPAVDGLPLGSLKPADVHGLIGDLYLLTGHPQPALAAYGRALAADAAVELRCGFPWDGKLYAFELRRPPNQDLRRVTGYLLALDPVAGRVLERHLLPGVPLLLSRRGGALAVGWYGPNGRCPLHLAAGRLSLPVQVSTFPLLRLSLWKSAQALVENFLYTDDNHPSGAFTPRSAASARAPAKPAELAAALRRAVAQDPTQPWYRFYLGLALFSRGHRREAEEQWRPLVAGGFAGIPYYDFLAMAGGFEAYGQPAWADRAYREALRRRRAIPRRIAASSVNERLIGNPLIWGRAFGRTAAFDPDRAYLWWTRTREIAGVAACDDLRARLWAGYLRRTGKPVAAARELTVLRQAQGNPWDFGTRSAWTDYALWLAAATLGGLLLALAWFLAAAVRAVVALLRRTTPPGRRAPAVLPALGLLATAMVAAGLGLGLLSFLVFYQQRWSFLLQFSDDALAADQPPGAAGVEPQVPLAATARLWLRRPWLGLPIQWHRLLAERGKLELPHLPWEPRLALLASLVLLGLTGAAKSLFRGAWRLIPGLAHLRQGAIYRGHALFCLFLFALGPALWLLAAKGKDNPVPGPTSTGCVDILADDLLLPPPLEPPLPTGRPAAPAERFRRLRAENFWLLVAVYPGSGPFYSLVALAGLTAVGAQFRQIRRLGRGRKGSSTHRPPGTAGATGGTL